MKPIAWKRVQCTKDGIRISTRTVDGLDGIIRHCTIRRFGRNYYKLRMCNNHGWHTVSADGTLRQMLNVASAYAVKPRFSI